jgi:hypothetical protein
VLKKRCRNLPARVWGCPPASRFPQDRGIKGLNMSFSALSKHKMLKSVKLDRQELGSYDCVVITADHSYYDLNLLSKISG